MTANAWAYVGSAWTVSTTSAVTPSLPTSGLTAHFDASTAADLFTTYVSGGPNTGTPTDGSSVAVWEDASGATHILKQAGGAALPNWRSSTPLLPWPCLDFSGTTRRLGLTNSTGTAQPISTIIDTNTCTVLIAFYAHGIAATANNYRAPALFEDESGYIGVLLSLDGGTPKVLAYNYDGSSDFVRLACATGTPHVVMMRHEGGTLYASLDGGAESSTASGATQVVGGMPFMGYGFDNDVLDARIGEIAVYNVALSGSNLTDAIAYFTDKWL